MDLYFSLVTFLIQIVKSNHGCFFIDSVFPYFFKSYLKEDSIDLIIP